MTEDKQEDAGIKTEKISEQTETGIRNEAPPSDAMSDKVEQGEDDECNLDKRTKESLENINVMDKELLRDLREVLNEREYQNLNVVIAHSIEGSNFFQGSAKEKTKGQNYNFTDKKDFLLFMQEKEKSYLKWYLLVLVGLRVVEIDRINYFMDQIKIQFQWKDNSDIEDIHLPFSDVVRILGTQHVTIQSNTQAGKIYTEAFAYNEEDIYKLRTIFWKEYVYMRQPMIEWLTRLCQSRVYTDRRLAEDALADFAKLDFYAVYGKLSLQGKQAKYSPQIYGMAKIMERAWENESYKENIRLLLSNWMQQDGNGTWQIAMLCYIHNSEMVKRHELQDCLETKADSFLENRAWVHFLALRAHEDEKICHILYDVLAKRFDDAMTQKDKEDVCLSLLNFLRLECYFVHEKSGDLTFIRVFEQKERRITQQSMMSWIWRTAEYRKLLEKVLDWYFSNLSEDFDEGYMRMFFRMLAFANSRTDYENMEVYLTRFSKKTDAKIKKNLHQWLQNLRVQKRISAEVK